MVQFDMLDMVSY